MHGIARASNDVCIVVFFIDPTCQISSSTYQTDLQLHKQLQQSRASWTPEVVSLSNAEGGEDAVQDVVRGGLAGEGVEGAQGTVQVGEEELVRDAALVGGLRGYEGFERRLDGLLLTKRVQDTSRCGIAFCVQQSTDGRAKIFEAFSC